MTAGRGGPALAAGLRLLHSLRRRPRRKGKHLGRTGEARCLLPLNVCDSRLPLTLEPRDQENALRNQRADPVEIHVRPTRRDDALLRQPQCLE